MSVKEEMGNEIAELQARVKELEAQRSAAVAAAIEQCAQVCNTPLGSPWTHASSVFGPKIRALQTEDGLAALREYVAKGVVAGFGYHGADPSVEQVNSCVDRVMKGE